MRSILNHFHPLNKLKREREKYLAEHHPLPEVVKALLLAPLPHLDDQIIDLDYLSLDRKAETLSGGEAQRIRLATQIGSNLTGVLYVLDEPSIGLHQKDNKKLISTLKHMVDIGNTLIVVEHDEETISEADYIVDIGPKAGADGGNVVATGTPKEIASVKESITGQFLSGEEKIEVPKTRRSGNGSVINITGASENNLQNINAHCLVTQVNFFTIATRHFTWIGSINNLT